jgi:hypothetical protein
MARSGYPAPRFEGKMQPKEWYHSLIRVADLLMGSVGKILN